MVVSSIKILHADVTVKFVWCSAIPLDESSKSDHVVTVVTARGGHIAFLDGLLGLFGPSYLERVFVQFFAAMFQHARDLDTPAS